MRYALISAFKEMDRLQIAVEYERGLHDMKGFVANKVERFLEHPLNKDEDGNHKYFHLEGSLHRNEYNSPPRISLDDLCHDLLEQEDVSKRICGDLEVYNIPISETGAGESQANPHPKVLGRTIGYNLIFGKEGDYRLRKISGIHLHIDQYKDRLADQYNLLLALRPTIAFTSTSSINHERMNSESCHRYKLFADTKDGVFARIPEERNYINSIDELKLRDRKRYQDWKAVFDAECWRDEVPADYKFTDYFKEHNTGYSDIRLRPDIGKGTFELRINDTAPLDVLQAQASLVSGYINRIMRENIPVRIADKKDHYKFSQEEVILPNDETLEEYSVLAIRYSLENEKVQQYLNALETFSKDGLEKREQHYLDPLRDMTVSGKNIASKILEHLGEHKQKYSVEDSARANLFVHELHQRGVENLRQKVGYHD